MHLEFEVVSVNVNRCLQNIYRYLDYIQLMTKTEFMENYKNWDDKNENWNVKNEIPCNL